MQKGQAKMDEFAYVLFAGLLLIVILMVTWSAIPQEMPPMVTPSSVSLSIVKGSSSSFTINVNGSSTKITLEPTGEIRDWINFDKNYFAIAGSIGVKVTVIVPFTAPERVHTGSILVSSAGGNRTIPVSLTVTKVSVTDVSQAFYFNDFTVNYILDSEIIASKEDAEVVKGLFADYPVNLVSESMTDEKFSMVTSGVISLIVDETNSGGSFIIELNGQELFRRIVGPEEVSIPLEKSQIKKSNVITIRVESSGWKFWMNTVYKIKNAKLKVNYMGVSAQEKTFNLNEENIKNFKYATISFRVKSYKTPLPELLIKINSQLVYMQSPPLAFFRQDFKNDILGYPIILNVGSNSISFSLEKQGSYDLADVTLIIVRSG